MSAPALIHTFGPEATGPGQKNGRPAEASRPIGEAMLQYTTETNIPQSIARTVTVLDDKETRRRQAEYDRLIAWLEEKVAQGKREPFSEIVQITPILAELLLKRNADNRPIRAPRLAELKADIDKGHWAFNGEAVIVSREGLLNDGQHRLMAVRDVGKSIRTTIVFGVQRSSNVTVDQGTARGIADYLIMQGKPDDAPVVGAVARLIALFDEHGTIETRRVKGQQPATKADILGVASDCEKEIRESLSKVTKNWTIYKSKSLVAFCHLIFKRKNATKADVFIHRMLTGENVGKNDPAFVLRERVRDDKKPLNYYDTFEAIVRAWNAFVKGRPLARIQIMGRAPEVEG